MSSKAKFSDLINHAKPVLVDFAAEWCSPCKMQKPILKQLVAKVGSDARVITVDVDRNREVAQKYRIMSVPTLAIFKEGKLLWQESGVKQLGELEKLISKYK
ncbi:MAG TPA: thiol reductase thioredoxin [Saprospirales bacterium]|nr:thiol reductase thioredoxin [Saprospirales bacterium]HAY71424.1 thiol reductase thioredoxin [Saprospirales bacterium]HRQ29455.1 thioredoxin family protein [Saprospiraceae bacterium]